MSKQIRPNYLYCSVFVKNIVKTTPMRLSNLHLDLFRLIKHPLILSTLSDKRSISFSKYSQTRPYRNN